jgi:hypothetical protein
VSWASKPWNTLASSLNGWKMSTRLFERQLCRRSVTWKTTLCRTPWLVWSTTKRFVRVAAVQVLGALSVEHAAAHFEAIAARLRDDVDDVRLAAYVVLISLGALSAAQSAALAELGFDAEFNWDF